MKFDLALFLGTVAVMAPFALAVHEDGYEDDDLVLECSSVYEYGVGGTYGGVSYAGVIP